MGFKLSVLPEEIEKLPVGSFPGKIHVIDHPGPGYNKAIAYLRKQKVLGFDTETRPVFSPGQKHHDVALVQLSGPDEAFLFRINRIGFRKRLRAVLANPEILKIGAACHDDVRGLQKLHGFSESGYVDLQKEVWQWGIKDKSVKKMAANILGVRISKAQQLSNWEADSLSEGQKMYAATDAWVCLEMWNRLNAEPKHPLQFDEQGNIKEG